MVKKGTIVTLILSAVVVGASIWVGTLFFPRVDEGTLIAELPGKGKDEVPSTNLDNPDDAPIAIIIPDEDTPAVVPPITDTVTNAPIKDKDTNDGKSASTPSSPTPSPPSKSSTRGEYWVQAGSFSSLARAVAAAEALQELGLSGTIETVTQGDRVLYRLRFGAWQNIAEAQRFRDYLRDQETLRRAFQSRSLFDRSSDFVDAYVVRN